MNNLRKAQIVDTLRLYALENERMEAALVVADDCELEYKQLTLVKVLDEKFVYAADMDEKFEHEAVVVDADGDGSYTRVYSSKNGKDAKYFVSEELSDWRYELYLELMRIAEEEDGQNGFDKRWAFDEAAGMSNEALVEAMTWNSPKEYAGIVSM